MQVVVGRIIEMSISAPNPAEGVEDFANARKVELLSGQLLRYVGSILTGVCINQT